MPRVFVYEYLTALGIGRDPGSPEHSLYREGRAMRDAVVEDFRCVVGCDATVIEVPDWDWAEHEKEFARAVNWSEFCLVIAPELGWRLGQFCELIELAGRRLLGPAVIGINITAAKARLAEHWGRTRVPTPRTYWWNDWFEGHQTYPAVCKPCNGAGSTAVFRLDSTWEIDATIAAAQAEGIYEDNLLFQPFVPGRPASVAFLIGEKETIPLLPTFQRLSADGRFRYLGGELPIPPGLAERAVRLGRRAVECVPGLFGYVGVDLVLGDAVDGSQDYAIEINPRLTTSYVGLRALADFNIAGAMLKLAAGEPLPPIRWKPGRVRFGADGAVDYDPTPGAVFE